MAIFQSSRLYIDFFRLPPPKIVEEIDVLDLLPIYKAGVLELRPDLDTLLSRETSAPVNILAAQSYAESVFRSRINAAGQKIMLPFSSGTTLDGLGANLNVHRKPGETDEQLRRRIQLAPEAFSSAGSPGSYVWNAISSDLTIKDVSAYQVRPGHVDVRVMNSGADPVPTEAQMENVRRAIFSSKFKPVSEKVTVNPVRVMETQINASVTLYPGPSIDTVTDDIEQSFIKLRDASNFIGFHLTQSAIKAALYREGVQNIVIESPTQDIVIGPSQVVKITKANILINTQRAE